MSRIFSSLRFRLLVPVFLALVPALGLTVYTAAEQRQLAAIQAQENAMRLVRTAAHDQELLIRDTHKLLTVLAQLPAVRDRVSGACDEALANLLESDPHYTNLTVSEKDGRTVCNPLRSDDPGARDATINAIVYDVFRQTLEAGSFVVGRYGIGPRSGKGILTFGQPILDPAGQAQAVIIATLDVASLNRLAANALLPLDATVTEIDRSGTIVAHYPDPEKWVGRTLPQVPIIKTILSRRQEGMVQALGEDGVERLYAFTPLPSELNGDLYVRVGIPTSVAYAEADQVLLRNLVALGFAAILALGAAWIGSEFSLMRPMNALLTVADRLAGGDLSVRTGLSHGAGEFGRLARAFDYMVGSLEQREQARRQAAEQVRCQAARAEALVEAARHLNAQLDLPGVLQAVCQETARAMSVPVVSVFLNDGTRELVCLAPVEPFAARDLELVQELPARVLDAARLHAGGVVTVPDVGRVPGLVEGAAYARLGLKTVAGTSLLRDGQPIGTLSLVTIGDSRSLSDDEQMLFRGLAIQAALAVANARLFATSQRQEQTRAELLHRVITAQEEERMRVARELHDETSQSLTTLMVALAAARKAVSENVGRVEEHLSLCRSVAEGMLDGIHRLIEDLRPSLLDVLGLLPAIASLGEQRLNPLGIELHVDDSGLGTRLPAGMETVLFRIVQEALANVARHAEASRVAVRLHQADGRLVLEIADDGRGFDPALQFDAHCFGLRGMRERVRILGGEFRLDTMPGAGAWITVRIPLLGEGMVHA